MDYVAGVLCVFLGAALALAVRHLSIRAESIEKRISALEDNSNHRYSLPLGDGTVSYDPAVFSDTDIVGAWAQEEEALGRRVSDEEIDLQRRMRWEAGL